MAVTCIFINAFSLREGGSVVVLRELLLAMHALRPEWSWQVATNEIALPRLPQLPRVHYHVVAPQMLGGWRSLWWYLVDLPSLLKISGAQVLFSQTNYLPLTPPGIPSLLLVQNAGHFSGVFRTLTLAAQPGIRPRLALALKGAWVRASLQRATLVTVQTAALKQAMLDQTGIAAEKISVIPHGCGLVPGAGLGMDTTLLPGLPAAGQPVRVGYITKFGVQKNFGVLFEAAALLRRRGMLLQLVLTLAPGPATDRVLGEAQRHGVLDLVDNHGELGAAEIVSLYRSLHVFVFPSLCESFGFPLVEALASSLPLLVADTASNVELAGPAALVFPPQDAAALARHVEVLVHSASFHAAQARLSLQRASAFSWTAAAAATAALLQRLMAVPEPD